MALSDNSLALIWINPCIIKQRCAIFSSFSSIAGYFCTSLILGKMQNVSALVNERENSAKKNWYQSEVCTTLHAEDFFRSFSGYGTCMHASPVHKKIDLSLKPTENIFSKKLHTNSPSYSTCKLKFNDFSRNHADNIFSPLRACLNVLASSTFFYMLSTWIKGK